MQKRTLVKATGCQAPYGIGEIMEDFPGTEAGVKKAVKYVSNYYNRPTIHDCMGNERDAYDGTILPL